MALNLEKLFGDVFHPQAGERVLVLRDLPHGELTDHEEWSARREMAVQWHQAFEKLGQKLGFSMLPLISYPATGTHNKDLPMESGEPLKIKEAFEKATLAVALTQWSATAFLISWTKTHPNFRAASMPMVARRMEETALAADYADVARRCQVLAEVMKGAVGGHVTFSTGHQWYADLRHREIEVDDGQLPPDKPGMRLINLPSGEVCLAPYEGEKEGDPSKTKGEIPVKKGDETMVFHIEENRITKVEGQGSEARAFRDFFEKDPARTNIAEFAFGCNPSAVVWGNILEDEKAGFHWAYGRSDHIGGVTSPARFKSGETVAHVDIVYAKDSPIQVEKVVLDYKNGSTKEVIKNSDYTVF